MSLPRFALAVFASLILAAPASAVVGGEKIAVGDVPWFAMVGGCGGTLVAPDRVLTAAHCLTGTSAADLGAVSAGGQTSPVAHIAMHPQWRHRNGENYLDDVALVQLAAPITGVAPVALGGISVERARIIGTGRAFAPGTGHSETEMLAGGLRQATLRTISDADCGRAFKGYRAADGERFDAARMRCAIDVDGRAPLSSGCNGDSGGPLVAAGNDAPVLLGVVSWGGDRCGADHLPSVFADVERYRAFITDPAPVWAPARHVPVRVSGRARLTCALAAAREPGTRLDYVWKRLPRWGRPVEIARGRHYTPGGRDGRVACFVYASNGGGQILAGVDD